jgi:hypothetical protein
LKHKNSCLCDSNFSLKHESIFWGGFVHGREHESVFFICICRPAKA